MPISREAVRKVCSGDEFELYNASLRLALPRLSPETLRTCAARMREIVAASRRRSSGKAPALPEAKPAGDRSVIRVRLRKGDLLAAALSRFEGRLRDLDGRTS